MGRKTFLTSWDDGAFHDVRLARLLMQYKIPAIFFIPTNSGQLTEEEIVWLDKSGFQIGGHTESHPEDMKTLSYAQQLQEIAGNKKWLESLVGHNIDWFAYPGGKYNDETIRAVKDAGFTMARTVVVKNIKQPDDQFRIKTTMQVYPETPRFNKPDWFKEASQLIKEGDYFHLWGHSWDLQRWNMWEELEKFLQVMYENMYPQSK